ncbi:glutathione S-transferase [Blastomonas sp.]|uniref:glutathione S-transferase n=1 Tax=Blastomonas sp. TaxID=1909299 RepID=UPI00391CA5ED
MTDLPILYSFRRCPYAMRARMAVLVSGQAVELREIVLRAKPQAMLDASPKATVPVLVLRDGTVIDESLDIMRWALSLDDPEAWLAGDDAALIAANDGPFKHHLDRYKYPSRYDEDPLAHRDAGLAHLMMLEDRLQAQAHVCGDRRGLADIALFPFVRQFAATDADWFADQGLPRVQAWLAQMTGSDLFARCMLRVPPWQPGDDQTVFAWN